MYKKQAPVLAWVTVLVAALTCLSSAHAGVIVGAVSATSTLGNNSSCSPSGCRLERTLDQSGLTIGYTSGVTDFDAYMAATPRHRSHLSNSIYLAPNGATIGSITYDLGGLFLLESFALWNRGTTNQGVDEFNLVLSEDASFTTTTTISGLVGGTSGGLSSALATVYDLGGPISAAFVRMDTLSSNNSFGTISFGEVAFEAFVPVPAPSGLAPFGLALALFWSLRRRHAARQGC